MKFVLANVFGESIELHQYEPAELKLIEDERFDFVFTIKESKSWDELLVLSSAYPEHSFTRDTEYRGIWWRFRNKPDLIEA